MNIPKILLLEDNDSSGSDGANVRIIDNLQQSASCALHMPKQDLILWL